MGKTVLVVDDSRAMRQLVGMALRKAGYEVTECPDGEEALAQVTDRDFSLVVCDVNMPRLDGLAFLERLRSLPAGRAAPPVVMLTTEAGERAKQEGRAGGARAWIVKPFRTEQLLEVVAKVAAAP